MLFILILQSKSNYDLFKVAPSKQNLKIPPGHRSLTASLQGCLNVPDWGSALLLPTGNASGKTESQGRRSEGCWVVGGSWQSPLWPTEQTSCSMAEPGGSPSDCPLQSRKEATFSRSTENSSTKTLIINKSIMETKCIDSWLLFSVLYQFYILDYCYV